VGKGAIPLQIFGFRFQTAPSFFLHFAPLAGRGRRVAAGEGDSRQTDSWRVPLTRRLRYRCVSDLSPQAGRGENHTPSHSRGAIRPSYAGTFRPLTSEGAGNAGRPMRPAAASAMEISKKHPR